MEKPTARPPPAGMWIRIIVSVASAPSAPCTGVQRVEHALPAAGCPARRCGCRCRPAGCSAGRWSLGGRVDDVRRGQAGRDLATRWTSRTRWRRGSTADTSGQRRPAGDPRALLTPRRGWNCRASRSAAGIGTDPGALGLAVFSAGRDVPPVTRARACPAGRNAPAAPARARPHPVGPADHRGTAAAAGRVASANPQVHRPNEAAASRPRQHTPRQFAACATPPSACSISDTV